MPRTLSKSDFKLASSCPTKLFYKEHGYPQATDGNPYIEMLADGGYMVEQLARLLYPDGIELRYGGDPVGDASATATMLEQESVTLFEATLLSNCKLARVDILRKRGRRLELIEVKSSSFDGAATASWPNGPFRRKTAAASILTDWVPYLQDVAFQYLVLQELYPDLEIVPHLLLVDKSNTTSIEALPNQFDIRRDVVVDGRRKDLDVRFTGDPATPAASELLRCFDVSGEVAELLPDLTASVEELLALYGDKDVRRVQQQIDWNCRACEFRVGADQRPSGFRECWGPLADVTPHLFELYAFGAQKQGGERTADRMIRDGRVSLLDVDVDGLLKADGTPSAASVRQRIQIEQTHTGTPWIGDGLGAAIGAWEYPLHFIDFETSAMALPYHAGMRPYEMVGFQWSCHTVDSAGATPVHTEWLNNRDSWPCLEFVTSLRNAVGEQGTVLMWSHHEGTTLRKIQDQMNRYGVGNADTRAWLDRMVGGGDVSARLFDMNKLCRDEFFVPGMGGRTSIKVVLDALWTADAVMRQRFAEWMRDDKFRVGEDEGPYESLPPVTVGDVELEVFEGTGAMRAYQAMLYGAERHDAELVAAYRDLLLRYCKLDTLAMVLIWDHWARVAK
ncbi:MAG: DUF2779 domain-containing protein [Gemmatimonadota bacterium]